MKFKEKIDKVLAVKKITITKLSQISGIGDTLQKAYRDNREMSRTVTERFLHKMAINSTWWETGEGSIILQTQEEDEINFTLPREAWDELKKNNSSFTSVITSFNKALEVMREDKVQLYSIIDKLITERRASERQTA
jgi:hypothetical protein